LQNILLTNLETYNDNLQDLAADNETFAVNITAARLLLNPDPQAVSPSHRFLYYIQTVSDGVIVPTVYALFLTLDRFYYRS